jgi:hypothetical protein
MNEPAGFFRRDEPGGSLSNNQLEVTIRRLLDLEFR